MMYYKINFTFSPRLKAFNNNDSIKVYEYFESYLKYHEIDFSLSYMYLEEILKFH